MQLILYPSWGRMKRFMAIAKFIKFKFFRALIVILTIDLGDRSALDSQGHKGTMCLAKKRQTMSWTHCNKMVIHTKKRIHNIWHYLIDDLVRSKLIFLYDSNNLDGCIILAISSTNICSFSQVVLVVTVSPKSLITVCTYM